MDVNTIFDIFYDRISQFMNCHVPRRKLSKHEIKLCTKPWITKPIVAKIRYRDKLYSKIIRCKHSNPNLIYFHKKFRNSVVTKMLKRASLIISRITVCVVSIR